MRSGVLTMSRGGFPPFISLLEGTHQDEEHSLIARYAARLAADAAVRHTPYLLPGHTLASVVGVRSPKSVLRGGFNVRRKLRGVRFLSLGRWRRGFTGGDHF